jgi:hypothetical protein
MNGHVDNDSRHSDAIVSGFCHGGSWSGRNGSDGFIIRHGEDEAANDMVGPDALINKGRPNQTIPVRLGHV